MEEEVELLRRDTKKEMDLQQRRMILLAEQDKLQMQRRDVERHAGELEREREWDKERSALTNQVWLFSMVLLRFQIWAESLLGSTAVL